MGITQMGAGSKSWSHPEAKSKSQVIRKVRIASESPGKWFWIIGLPFEKQRPALHAYARFIFILCFYVWSTESGTHGVGGDDEVGGKRDPRRASVAMVSSLLLFLRAVESHQYVEWPWISSHKLSCEEIHYFCSLQYANLTILSPFHQMANHEFLSIH